MPEHSAVKRSGRKIAIAGLSVLIVLSAAAFLVLRAPGILPHYVELRTYMDDASGLADGTVVRLDGIAIGYLDRLRLTSSPDPKRKVEFVMKVGARYLREIPVDSRAGVASSNLLGDDFLNIVSGQSSRHVQPGAELPAIQAQDVPQMMAQMGNAMQSLSAIATRGDRMLSDVELGRGNIGRFTNDKLERLSTLQDELRKLQADVRSGRGTAGKLFYDDELSNQAQSARKRLDGLLAGYQAGQGTAGKMGALSDEIQQTTREIQQVVADIHAGRGSAGRLPELQKQIDLLMTKADDLSRRAQSGQGTIGQLFVNPQFSDALSGATRDFQALAGDLKKNPKKMMTFRFRVF